MTESIPLARELNRRTLEIRLGIVSTLGLETHAKLAKLQGKACIGQHQASTQGGNKITYTGCSLADGNCPIATGEINSASGCPVLTQLGEYAVSEGSEPAKLLQESMLGFEPEPKKVIGGRPHSRNALYHGPGG